MTDYTYPGSPGGKRGHHEADLVRILDGFPPPPWSREQVDNLYSIRSNVVNGPHTPTLDHAVFRFVDRLGRPPNREPLPFQQMAEWLAGSDVWQLDEVLIDALRDHPHEQNVNVFAYMMRGTRRELAGIPFTALIAELMNIRMAWSPKETLKYVAASLEKEAKTRAG